MFKKKSVSLLLALLLVLTSLTACGKEGAKEKEEVENTGSVEVKEIADIKVEDLEWGKLRPEGLSESFPEKPITYLYAFGPGSPQDAYIRTLFNIIEKNEGWKNKFVVEYKEGASGRIGWNYLANHEPDGYLLGFTPTAMLIPAVSENVDFGMDKIDMLFNMMSDPGVVGVAANSKYNTLADLLNDAKENPDTISMGVTSTVGQEGLTTTLLERASGAKFKVAPFNSEPDVLAAVQGGHVDAFCLNVSDCTTFVENGTIKFLATGAEERSEYYPDIPTYKEAGFDVTQLNMRAVSYPKGVDPLVREYLEKCFLLAASTDEAKKKVEELQIPVDTLNAKEVTELFNEFTDVYQKLYDEEPWQAN